MDFRLLQTPGPTTKPFVLLVVCRKWLLTWGEGARYHVAHFSGPAGEDECHRFAVALLEVVGVHALATLEGDIAIAGEGRGDGEGGQSREENGVESHTERVIRDL